MSLVISDPLPLHNLVFCRIADLLPQLFVNVVIPPAVFNELQQAGSPPMVRHWLDHAPSWLTVQKPSRLNSFLQLERGDIEAICLAQQINARAILADDHAVRTVAARCGLTVVGTLGILEFAALHGLIDLPKVIATLRQAHARFDPALISHALDQTVAVGK